jgi:hypothetical protein
MNNEKDNTIIQKTNYSEEMIMIYNILKTLNIEDTLLDFNKFTQYKSNSYLFELAPYDLLLEDFCEYGYFCFYKRDPQSCCKNHQTNNSIIMRGTELPNYLCKYERPWRFLNGYPMRCQNIYCWYSHLAGHKNNLQFNNYNF